MGETVRYTVNGMSCAHCEAAVRTELLAVPGVKTVAVDLATKQVVATGTGLVDHALRAAISTAGYTAT